jgi:hypothetical protein
VTYRYFPDREDTSHQLTVTRGEHGAELEIIHANVTVEITVMPGDIDRVCAEIRGASGAPPHDPLHGCADPVVAQVRARALVSPDAMTSTHQPAPAGAAADVWFWDEQARRVLTALLHAAALCSYTVRDLREWLEIGDTWEAQRALTRHGQQSMARTLAALDEGKTSGNVRHIVARAVSGEGDGE